MMGLGMRGVAVLALATAAVSACATSESIDGRGASPPVVVSTPSAVVSDAPVSSTAGTTQPPVGFTLGDHIGEVIDVGSTERPLVEPLGFEQLVLQHDDGGRVSVVMGAVADGDSTVNDAEFAASSESEGYGWIRDGGVMVHVMVHGAPDPEAVWDHVRRGAASEPDTWPGFVVVDRRSEHGPQPTAVTTITYRPNDEALADVTLSFGAIEPDLSVEVAAPLLAGARVLEAGERIVVAYEPFGGEPARATWLEAGMVVTVRGGRSVDEVMALVDAVIPTDGPGLDAVEEAVQGVRRSYDELSTVELAGRSWTARRSPDGEVVVCVESTCEPTSMFNTAASLVHRGDWMIVATYPAGSDPVTLRVAPDITPMPESSVGHEWVVFAVPDGIDVVTLEVTVGEVPPLSASVSRPPA